MRYEIKVTDPWSDPTPAYDIDFGYSRTLETAMRRAERLSLSIRTDCTVYIVADGRILATTGVNGGPGGVATRRLVSVPASTTSRTDARCRLGR